MTQRNTPWSPGPWTARENDIYADNEMISVAYGFEDSRGKIIRTPTTYANAALIALAPEMAEALQGALERLKAVPEARVTSQSTIRLIESILSRLPVSK